MSSLMQLDQQRITALDTVSVAIRGWVVTLDSALVAFAFTKASPDAIAVAITATLLFLPLDFRYRRTQLLHAQRSSRIEQELVPEYPLRTGTVSQSRPPVRGLSSFTTLGMFYTALLVLLAAALLAI
jgi:hypothetical protein